MNLGVGVRGASAIHLTYSSHASFNSLRPGNVLSSSCAVSQRLRVQSVPATYLHDTVQPILPHPLKAVRLLDTVRHQTEAESCSKRHWKSFTRHGR